MATRIKGITVKIGGDVTDLEKALQKTNKEIGSTQSQLKDVERLLKLDPKNTTLLAQKQKLLAQAAGETREKLKQLNEANDQAAKSVKNYDKWKAAYDPIQSQIDATRKKLKELRDQQQELSDAGEVDTDAYKALAEEAKQTARELSALNKQARAVSEEFGNPVSPKQYDALQREIAATESSLNRLEDQAEDTKKAMKSLPDALEGLAGTAGTLSSVTAPVTTAVVGMATAIAATVPATEELRIAMSRLDANAQGSGVSTDAARAAWNEFMIQCGDTGSAVEAVSNLLQAGFSENNLQRAVEHLAAAANAFPDTLKVESLADGLQETLATGKAAGQFAELLERMGMDVDEFNTLLATCQTETGRQNVVLNTLVKTGLKSSYDAWKQNNQALVENRQANLEMEQSMAQLAEVAMPILTEVIRHVAALISWFADLPEGAQVAIAAFLGVAASISPIAGAVSGSISLFEKMTTTVLPAVQNGFTTVFGFIAANPIVLIIGAILAVVAAVAVFGDEIQAVLQQVDDFLQGVFAKDWTEVFGPVLGGALNGFFSFAKGIWDGLKQILDGVIDFIRGVFTGDWERAWRGVVGIFSGLFSGLVTIALVPINGLIGMINDFIDCLNLAISGANALLGLNIGQIGHIPELNAGMITGSGNTPAGSGGSSGGSGGGGRPGAAAIPFMASGGELFSGSAIVGEAGAELLTVANGRAIVQPLSSNTSNATYMGGVNITVYGAPGQDERALVDILMEEMQARVERTEVALT